MTSDGDKQMFLVDVVLGRWELGARDQKLFTAVPEAIAASAVPQSGTSRGGAECSYSSIRGDCHRTPQLGSLHCGLHRCPTAGCARSKASKQDRCPSCKKRPLHNSFVDNVANPSIFVVPVASMSYPK